MWFPHDQGDKKELKQHLEQLALTTAIESCTLTDQTPDGLTEAVSKASHLMRYCTTQKEQEKMLLDLMLKLKSVEIYLVVSVEFELRLSK